jgi:hypothetical protein
MEKDSSGFNVASNADTAGVAGGGSGNSAPSISGTPPSQVNANNLYSFTPTASDADEDTLTFSISGLPPWGAFDTRTGELHGLPSDADVGVYDSIKITVFDDSSASDSLGPFSVTVQAISMGAVTLNWQPPTQNEDGTPLVDLLCRRLPEFGQDRQPGNIELRRRQSRAGNVLLRGDIVQLRGC